MAFASRAWQGRQRRGGPHKAEGDEEGPPAPVMAVLKLAVDVHADTCGHLAIAVDVCDVVGLQVAQQVSMTWALCSLGISLGIGSCAAGGHDACRYNLECTQADPVRCDNSQRKQVLHMNSAETVWRTLSPSWSATMA